MSEEEKKAIEILNDEIISLNVGHQKYKEAVKTILNIIKKQDKNIKTLENTLQGYKGLANLIDIKQAELEKKDKMMNLAIEKLRYFNGMNQEELFCYDICKKIGCDNVTEEHCRNCIKQHFKKKVEE